MYLKKERCTKEWNFISHENNLQKTCQNIIKHMFCLLARDMKNSLNVRVAVKLENYGSSLFAVKFSTLSTFCR